MPLAARAGADEQGDVGVVEGLVGVVGDLDAGEQREGAVVELHGRRPRAALRAGVISSRLQDRPGWSRPSSCAAGDAEQQAVADLAGGAGDGDLDGSAEVTAVLLRFIDGGIPPGHGTVGVPALFGPTTAPATSISRCRENPRQAIGRRRPVYGMAVWCAPLGRAAGPGPPPGARGRPVDGPAAVRGRTGWSAGRGGLAAGGGVPDGGRWRVGVIAAGETAAEAAAQHRGRQQPGHHRAAPPGPPLGEHRILPLGVPAAAVLPDVPAVVPEVLVVARAVGAGAVVGVSRPAGCGAMPTLPFAEGDKKSLVRQRVIDNLANDEALVGADVAAALSLQEGAGLTVLGQAFKVTAVLPQTGTVDDSRIFAHLHRVQDLAAKGPVVNAIEIVGCCQEISNGLVQKINTLLPEAKVVTITQIADAQIKMNHMMSRLSFIFLVIIVFVGGAGIANYMYANVFERRREIGTLMALGASSFSDPADLPAEGPVAGTCGGRRRLCAGHGAGDDVGAAIGGCARAAHAVTGTVGRLNFRRLDLDGQFLPGPPSRSARSLCDFPGDLTHVEDGKSYQEISTSRRVRDGAGQRERDHPQG